VVNIDSQNLRRILDADGEFELDTSKFRISYIQANNTLCISGDVNVKITGANVNIEANEINLDANSVNIGGVAAQALVNERVVDWLNSHTHPAPGGATSAPTVPAIAANFTTQTLKSE
jgi:hypothetical protein